MSGRKNITKISLSEATHFLPEFDPRTIAKYSTELPVSSSSSQSCHSSPEKPLAQSWKKRIPEVVGLSRHSAEIIEDIVDDEDENEDEDEIEDENQFAGIEEIEDDRDKGFVRTLSNDIFHGNSSEIKELKEDQKKFEEKDSRLSCKTDDRKYQLAELRLKRAQKSLSTSPTRPRSDSGIQTATRLKTSSPQLHPISDPIPAFASSSKSLPSSNTHTPPSPLPQTPSIEITTSPITWTPSPVSPRTRARRRDAELSSHNRQTIDYDLDRSDSRSTAGKRLVVLSDDEETATRINNLFNTSPIASVRRSLSPRKRRSTKQRIILSDEESEDIPIQQASSSVTHSSSRKGKERAVETEMSYGEVPNLLDEEDYDVDFGQFDLPLEFDLITLEQQQATSNTKPPSLNDLFSGNESPPSSDPPDRISKSKSRKSIFEILDEAVLSQKQSKNTGNSVSGGLPEVDINADPFRLVLISDLSEREQEFYNNHWRRGADKGSTKRKVVREIENDFENEDHGDDDAFSDHEFRGPEPVKKKKVFPVGGWRGRGIWRGRGRGRGRARGKGRK